MKGHTLKAMLDRQPADSRATRKSRAKVLAGAMLTAGAAYTCAPDALAAIQYHDQVPDESITAAVHPIGAPFNINIAGANRFKIYYSAFLANGPSFNDLGVAVGDANAKQVAAGNYARNFAAGSTIGAGATWRTNWDKICGSGGAGNFDGVTGYVGIRFDPGAGTRYGWIQVTGAANGLSCTVNSWAYQDDGTGIRAGEGQ